MFIIISVASVCVAEVICTFMYCLFNYHIYLHNITPSLDFFQSKNK